MLSSLTPESPQVNTTNPVCLTLMTRSIGQMFQVTEDVMDVTSQFHRQIKLVGWVEDIQNIDGQ